MVKVKGFTLTKHAGDIITFDLMKSMVEKNDPKFCVNVTTPRKIVRNLKDRNIFTVPFNKMYGVTFDKRVLYGDFNSRPYGFQ